MVLDVVVYEEVFASAGGGLDTPGRLERWTADPAMGRVDRRVIDPSAQEFHLAHRIPPGFHGNWLPKQRTG